jgi:hypothetical protein
VIRVIVAHPMAHAMLARGAERRPRSVRLLDLLSYGRNWVMAT